MRKSLLSLAAVSLLALVAGPQLAAAADALAAGFDAPPVSARPLGWWHWINGNVTKDGIAADLESFQRQGLGGVQMFDVEIYLPPGPVRYGSENWHEHMQFAIRKAAELGLDFHVMNTPGWSASGGPWVTPALSMKRVVFTETNVAGGAVALDLPPPDLKPFYGARGGPKERFYQDIAVLAVPVNAERLDDLPGKIAWKAKPVTRPAAPARPGIAPEQVIDLTAQMDARGRLTATLPPGDWTLLRFGFTSTGKTNHPAVPEGHGLEIDKLDATAVAFQFEQAMGRLLRDAGPLGGKTFNGLLFDSFEGGFQNWTANFPAEFRRLKGYDFVPWLPLLTGRVIGSTAASEAVLWDFRHVIDELIAENYYGTMHRLAAQHGVKIYSESQGGPINPMSANRHVDVPMNEFWTPDALGRASRIKQSTSAAAFHGRHVVAAEAFTSTPENGKFQNTPGSLKRSGDLAFTLGLNRFALHSLTHQPFGPELAPGFALGRYGVHFGRHNTWWPYADAWFAYLSRSQFLLQQGRTFADVCLMIDEDLGYGLASKFADAFPGYDYEVAYPDYVRAMSVQDGRVVHPAGGRYRVLMVPDKTVSKSWVVQLATLRHLRQLVQDGAVLAGEPPTAPAGLQDLAQRAEFDRLVGEIWGGLDGRKQKMKRLGAGKVYTGLKPLDLLREEGVAPDLAWPGAADTVKFIHRTAPDAEIYFVFNYSAEARTLPLTFRQPGRTPEVWDPLRGTRQDAPVFAAAKGGVEVPLTLAPWGSAFVVFRRPLPAAWLANVEADAVEFTPTAVLTPAREAKLKSSDGRRRTVALPDLPPALTVVGPWEAEFKDGRGAPPRATFAQLQSWSEHADAGIRFYSGTAVYRTQITVPAAAPAQVARLDLGRVADIARVYVNGREAGVAWTAPFRLDVTALLQPGVNTLEIHVANRWINRLIGDEAIDDGLNFQKQGVSKFTDGRLLQLPDWLSDPARRTQRKRQSFHTWKHYDADSPLVPSGLLGPVKLEWLNRVPAE